MSCSARTELARRIPRKRPKRQRASPSAPLRSTWQTESADQRIVWQLTAGPPVNPWPGLGRIAAWTGAAVVAAALASGWLALLPAAIAGVGAGAAIVLLVMRLASIDRFEFDLAAQHIVLRETDFIGRQRTLTIPFAAVETIHAYQGPLGSVSIELRVTLAGYGIGKHYGLGTELPLATVEAQLAALRPALGERVGTLQVYDD